LPGFFQADRYYKNEKDSILNHVQTTGYYRCKHCNAAGNWEFPERFIIEISLKAMVHTRLAE
jgi:hypothetical protein